MEINKARNVQKRLFQLSDVPFKKTRTILDVDGNLFYVVYHQISESDSSVIEITRKSVNRINESITAGLIVMMEYNINNKSIPKAIYMTELIPID